MAHSKDVPQVQNARLLIGVEIRAFGKKAETGPGGRMYDYGEADRVYLCKPEESGRSNFFLMRVYSKSAMQKVGDQTEVLECGDQAVVVVVQDWLLCRQLMVLACG